MTAKPKTSRRVRVRIDAIIEYDRDLTDCPLAANEYHGREIVDALKTVYSLRPGAKRVGLTSLRVGLDHRKVKS